MKVRNIIERHTYLYHLVFDKEPKDRKDSDIHQLIDYENKEVEWKQ